MSKGKRYTQQFKEAAVKQIVERGYCVGEVADRLGICTKTLYHWRATLQGSSQQTKSSDDQTEIVRLKVELMRVTEERDILKIPQEPAPCLTRGHLEAAKYVASQLE